MGMRQGSALTLLATALALSGCAAEPPVLPEPPAPEQRIAALLIADAEADDLAKCEAHPVPWFATWSQEDFAALCRHLHTRTLQRWEVERAWKNDGAAGLHRLFAERRQAHARGETHADALIWDFQNFYWEGEETRAMAEAWLAAFPDDAAAHLALAESLRVEWWDVRGEELARDTPSEQLERASVVLERMTTLARRAVALEPTHPMGPRVLMEALTRQSGNAEAFDVLAAALRQHPGSYVLRQQALRAAAPAWGGSLDDARLVAAEADTQAKAFPVVGFLRTGETMARAFYERSAQNDQAALPLWMEAFRTGLDDDNLVHAADSASLMGDELLGAEFRTLQLRLHGPSPRILMRRARSWGALGRNDLAGADLEAASRLAPKNVDVIFERGAFASASGDNTLAAQRYREALALDPGHYYASLALAELQVWTLGQSAEAVPVLEAALKRQPGDAHLLYVLADAYAVVDDPRAKATAEAYLAAIDPASKDPQTRWRINYIRELIPQLR